MPQAIISFNDTFDAAYDIIMQLLKDIGSNPPTDQQKQALMDAIQALKNELDTQQTHIQGVRDQVVQFNDNLSSDNTALTTGSASVTNAITEDKKKVVDLTADISKLQVQISTMQKLLTAAEIGIVAGVVVSMILMETGPAALVVGVLSIGGSAAALIAAATIIRKDQDKIIDDQADIKAESAQIVVLNTIANTVSKLVDTIKDAGLQMDTVLGTWATLSTKMQAVITKLNQASGTDWLKIIKEELDMNSSKRAWDQLTDFATKMQQTTVTVSSDPPLPIRQAA